MNNDKIWQTLLVLLGGFISGGIGFLAGWFLNRLQREDERADAMENRQRHFRAWMNQLLGEALAYHPMGTYAKWYSDKVPNILYEAATVRMDFKGNTRTEFDALISKLTGFGVAVENPQTGQAILIEAIHNVGYFLEKQSNLRTARPLCPKK